MTRCVLAVLVVAGSLHAIGMQHGTFASRSTQGRMWQGTSSIVAERYRITVMPAYLDVEVDWEFDVGGMKPDSFTNSLEIVGNLNLAQDAAVIGMLLWNSDTILKARLKPVQVARQQYEQVVDRNAPVPPRPRDPIVFEYGQVKDNYDISIFPVSWGSTRKCRLRYLIPSINFNGTAKIPYPHALSPQRASITLLRGPGIDSFAVEGYAKTMVKTDSIRFTCSDKIYQGLQLISPQVHAGIMQSTIYTAAFEAGAFQGTMAQVVGIPAAEVIKRSNEKQDIVILWRWNHPEVLKEYAWQLVKQAAVIEAFCNALDEHDKRAGMVVDIQGGERIVYDLSLKGKSAYVHMMQFLDSLQLRDAPVTSGGSRPIFTRQEIDSIVAQSIAEFTRSLALAMSLFDESSPAMKSVVLVTAGPRLVADTRQKIDPVLENGILIQPMYDLVSSSSANGTDPSSVNNLYWPGMNFSGCANAARSYTVTAEITNGTKTISKSFSGNPVDQSYYSWGYTSVNLDLKLYSTVPLAPIIRWKVLSSGTMIASYSEVPAVVTLFDGLQFARVLAGSTRLQALDGALPSPLSTTFGFVDTGHALLALEEDAMQPADQLRYRIAGVPPLTTADITFDTKNIVNESVMTNGPSTAIAAISKKQTSMRNDISISLRGALLHIQLGTRLRATGKEVRIQIFNVSGRLLSTFVVSAGPDGLVQARLLSSIMRSNQVLIVHISIGSETFVRQLTIR